MHRGNNNKNHRHNWLAHRRTHIEGIIVRTCFRTSVVCECEISRVGKYNFVSLLSLLWLLLVLSLLWLLLCRHSIGWLWQLKVLDWMRNRINQHTHTHAHTQHSHCYWNSHNLPIGKRYAKLSLTDEIGNWNFKCANDRSNGFLRFDSLQMRTSDNRDTNQIRQTNKQNADNRATSH